MQIQTFEIYTSFHFFLFFKYPPLNIILFEIDLLTIIRILLSHHVMTVGLI